MPIKECFVAFESADGRAFRLQAAIECKAVHSYSAVLAISNHLMRAVPEVDPPVPAALLEQLKPRITPAFNPLFEFWYAFLVKCVQQGLAHRHQDTFYLTVPASHLANQDVFAQSNSFQLVDCENLQAVPNTLKCSKIFSLAAVERSKRIGFFIVSSNVKTVPIFSRYDPAAILIGHFFNN